MNITRIAINGAAGRMGRRLIALGSDDPELEIAAALEIGEEQTEALSRRVNAMARDAQLVRNRRGGYCVVNKQDLIAGRIIGHPDGFGAVFG